MIKKRNIKAKNIRSSTTTTTTTTADDDRNNESIHPQQQHSSTQSYEHENRPEHDSRDHPSSSSSDTQRSQLNNNDDGEHHNDHNNQQSDQNREEMDTLRKVELVKLKQRSSAKRKGVMIKDSTGQPIKSSSSSSSTHSATTNQSSSSSSLSSSSSSILSSSASSALFEGKFAARAKSETEKKMEEFVEMEMKKRGFMTSAEKEKLLSSVVSLDDDDDGGDGGGESQQQLQQAAISTNGSGNGKKSAKMSIDITELYKIPEQYRPNRSLFKDDPIPGSMLDASVTSHDEMSTDMIANEDVDVGNNGNEENTAQVAEYERRMAEKQQLMTGSILEVKLPMEYRIKNVQETEKAAKSAKRLHHEAQYTTVTSSEGTKVIVPTRQVRAAHHPPHSSMAGDHRGMRTTDRSAAPSSSNDDAELRQYLGDDGDGDNNGYGGGDSNASDVNNERVDHGSSRERDDRQRQQRQQQQQQSTGRGRDNNQHQRHNSNRRQGSGKRPHAVASDDAHFERFIKRYRRR